MNALDSILASSVLLGTSLTFVYICLTINKLGKKTENQNTTKAQRRRFHPSCALFTAAFGRFYIAIPLFQTIINQHDVIKDRDNNQNSNISACDIFFDSNT